MKPPASETARRPGRPKRTTLDAVPVTFHISADVYRRAQMARLTVNEKRPLSKIVEQMLDAWSAARAV